MRITAKNSSSGQSRCRLRVGILTATLIAVAPPVCAAQHSQSVNAAWQDTSAIRNAARDFVAAAIQLPPNSRISLEAGNLDERLQLPRCAKPLVAFATPGTELSRGGTVGVRCTADTPWKIYVPVRLSVMTPVVIASQALARGASLKASDFELAERDLATLPGGYLTDVGRLENKNLRRRVLPGTVITPSMLVQSHAVRRGQRVTLVAGAKALNIRMAGTAMGDGGIGDRVTVRNLSSGRTVEGIVRSNETVEILQY